MYFQHTSKIHETPLFQEHKMLDRTLLSKRVKRDEHSESRVRI